jgi:hypothetical protein
MLEHLRDGSLPEDERRELWAYTYFTQEELYPVRLYETQQSASS